MRSARTAASRSWRPRWRSAGRDTSAKIWTTLRRVEPGRIAGTLFVIWAPAPEPEEESRWRKKVADLGVPADAVTFVFQERLARELCQPRFAAIWVDLLRLPSTCNPFQRIREVEGVFGLETFAPTLREYDTDAVHRPSLLTAVKECLEQQGWAWVRGRGATGKTVLAARLALDHERHGGPAYYLDLAALDVGRVDAADLFDVLTTRADADVFFVVDNVHLAAELASALYKHWREVGQGSRWLMLGRLQELGTHPRGTGRPLEELMPLALELENTEEDLCGVYERLVRRLDKAVIRPPREVLGRWLELFAADLIAFCAAVIRRLDNLARGCWALEASDAKAYVRDEYLGGSGEERQNLLRLAAMTSIELLTPEESLEVYVLKKALQRGYVLRSEHGRERNRSYRLIHPGLAELLLSSITPPMDRLQLLAVIASKSTYASGSIAARLEGLGRAGDSTEILQAVTKESERLLSLLTPEWGLSTTARNLQRLVRLGVRTARELDEILAPNVGRLAEAALRTPLQFLASFLDYAERALPEAHKNLAAELQKPENVGQLAEAALRTPLEYLTSFLTFAERVLPEAHKAFVAELQKPDNVRQLTETALKTPKPDNIRQLTENALKTPLHILASFLIYAERELPEIHKFLAAELQKTENVRQLREAALTTPLDNLLFFLSLPKLGAAVLTDINLDAWRESRNLGLSDTSQEVAAFPQFAKVAIGLNRSDLTESTAISILTTSVPKLLPTDFNLKNLSSLLYHGRLGAPSAAAHDFVRLVAPASWLASQYTGAQAGTIAGSLLTIWRHHPALIRLFHHPELPRRLRRELAQSHGQVDEELNGTLRLLGVVDLIRVLLPKIQVRWPGMHGVASALVDPPPEMETIGTVQVQLWLGLRTMSRLRKDRVKIPPEHAEQVLALWRKGETETERQRAFNEWMIAWLERCARAGWALVPDESRFDDSR